MSIEAGRRTPRVDSFDDVFEVFDDVFEVPAAHRAATAQRRDREPVQAGSAQRRDREPVQAQPQRRARERSQATAHRERQAARGGREHATARQLREAELREVTRRRDARRPSQVRRRREAPTLPLPKAAFMVLVAVLVVVGLVGVLVLRTKINENSFRLGDLRQSQQALSLQEQQLEQQLADLSSPGNLLAAAARLGLVQAGTPAYLNLPDGRVVGVPQPATGQDGIGSEGNAADDTGDEGSAADDTTGQPNQQGTDTSVNPTTEPTGR
jgi:cell division protein FtsL